MTPERWQQVKAIFNSALEYRPEDRESFLSGACSGDAHLRSEVESLIASHEKSGEFIDDPAYQKATWLADEKAELQAGQTIGSYQVLSFISRGGMGEVYLAQDQRLNRKVALKILPSTFTKDLDRLRRFEQEARSASALNHPNIITIYEIQQLGGTHVIATEFVEGETLRQRLQRAPLTLSEALNISIQVADALSAAHKAGIIHRDIKPENVMLRPDGYVKVLDFGLAKLSEQATPAMAAEAPTIQVRTGSGIVIGTAGYMSPEQARGLSVDARSDVFSFGAMIYEMVARRKPFEGDTPSDTLASILKTEPTPLLALKPGLPAELNRIVSKSLRKDREERYQVVKELWLDLKSLKQELEFQEKLERSVVPDKIDTAAPPDFTSVIPLAQTTEPRSAITLISESLSVEIKRHKLRTALTLFVLALFVGAASFGVYKYVNRPLPVSHFWDIKLSRITSSGDVIDATVSPDGKYIVFAKSDRSTQSLWIRQVTTANEKLIVPPAPVGIFGITFAPDGNDLYYVVKSNLDTGTLYRVPVLGGTPTKILESLDGPISFAPDGKHFVLVRGNHPKPGNSALVISNLEGTEQRDLVVKTVPERFTPIFFTGPSWSPDGKLIASTVARLGGPSRVMAYSVADGTEQQLTTQTWFFAARVQWLPDMTGLLVVAGGGARDSQQWFISYPEGKARAVTNDLNAYRAIGMTTDGKKFTTVQAEGLVNLYVVPKGGDNSNAVRLPTGNVGFYGTSGNNVCWLPDGRIVLSTIEAGEQDIWVMNADGGNRKQLTTTSGQNVSPVITPDGKYVVYASLRDGVKSLWRVPVDGGAPIRLTSGTNDSFPAITPDGKQVLFTSIDGARPTIWRVSIDGGTPQQITDHTALAPKVSPDGKWMMYLFAESADPFAPPNRVAVVPFAGEGESKTFEIPASSTTAIVVQWAPDGKSIIYSVNNNNVSNLWSQQIADGSSKQITNFTDSLITGFAFSADGQLACTRGVLRRDAVLITDMK